MSAEVQLKPGWLMKDVRRASERLTEWSKPRNESPAHNQTREYELRVRKGSDSTSRDESRSA